MLRATRATMLRLPLAATFVLLTAACSNPAAAQNADPPPLAREFRGAWVATVNNIDFPSRPGLTSTEMRAELDAIVARAAELKLNALVFQVRPAADALYKSPLEPWAEWLTGTQGKAPDGGFDPLAYVIERCHERGLQLHAWFNPFRAWHKAGKSVPAPAHVTQKAPAICVKFGDYEWMDPGEPLAAKWSLATIQDVVQRYDVDGVHLDDYFYPYPEGKAVAFPDDASYAKYRAGGGTLARSDWRRQNIDAYVQRLYTIVHEAKPHVAVGISPFGIARPGVPRGIQAGLDQYETLAADAPKWLREGLVDYLSPQLYWAIDDRPHAFDVLAPWWQSQNPKGRCVWPGLSAVNALAGAKSFRPDELVDEIAILRGAKDTGHVLYSFKALRSNAANVGGALRDRIYRDVAIAPAMPWLGSAAPRTPIARVEGSGASRTLRCELEAGARFVAVQVQERTAGWRTLAVLGGARRDVAIPAGVRHVAVTAISSTGVASAPLRLPVVD